MYKGNLLGKAHFKTRAKAQNKLCIFAGPSLWYWQDGQTVKINDITQDADLYAPAALGHIHQAVLAGYSKIILADGRFGDCPAPWHKEILFALDNKCHVYGCSSMGALRAAELYHFGMHGVGQVFEYFKNNILDNDDAVCVAHADHHYGYRPLSISLVDILITLNQMTSQNILDDKTSSEVFLQIKSIHYPNRRFQLVKEILGQQGISSDVFEFFSLHYHNAKHDDLKRTLHESICHKNNQNNKNENQSWQFPVTDHWRHQFILNRRDLPALKSIHLNEVGNA